MIFLKTLHDSQEQHTPSAGACRHPSRRGDLRSKAEERSGAVLGEPEVRGGRGERSEKRKDHRENEINRKGETRKSGTDQGDCQFPRRGEREILIFTPLSSHPLPLFHSVTLDNALSRRARGLTNLQPTTYHGSYSPRSDSPGKLKRPHQGSFASNEKVYQFVVAAVRIELTTLRV